MSVYSRFRKTASAALGAALLAGGALFAAPAQAQGVDYSALEADPAIWHLSDADSDVYIFGTFHILPASLNWRTDELRALLAAADTLYLEADVHSPEAQAQLQQLVIQNGLNPPGVTLSSLLTDEANAALAELAPTLGVAPGMLEPMRPWLAQVMLAVTQMQALGLDPNAGAEAGLLGLVAGTETGMGYFETAAEQIGFLAGIPDEVQVQAFDQGLEQMSELPRELDRLVTAWATGDVETLEAMLNDNMRDGAPEVFQALIVDRNLNWIPQIEAIMDGEGTVVIAVGAAHLPGEEGVIHLLETAGYTVSRQ